MAGKLIGRGERGSLVGEVASVAEVAGHPCRHRLAALSGGDSGELPTAQKGIRHAANIREESATTPDRQFIEITESKARAQMGCNWAVLQVSSIGVLNKPAHVAVGVAKVLGEGVGRQKVESIREPFIQGSLKRVIEHLQLRVVERQNRRHIRLLVEISAAEIRLSTRPSNGIRPAEIGV